ncbi:hypothetical protein B0I00_1294 [Novosphingobium kunmingense]|uniref:Uncharacterized protein n=1 Tax=Novosphingobium kunmingense TaxID=1211806 RepID=A0A2N0HJF1_9SPHN|nr:hypothetical protein B0I00_1294 [Novosphingobium kunmingense]
MSRAMNLKLPEANVRKRCDESGVSISAIEPLPAGGTHLVCTTGEGADEMRLRLADYLIAGSVRRFPFYRARGPW